MDIADTLRRRSDLEGPRPGAAEPQADLIARLRTIYNEYGIAVPDHVLKQGVEALENDRFAYHPPRDGLRTRLALAYVSRGRWGRPVLVALAGLAVVAALYFLAYQPVAAWQAEQARIELEQTLPDRIDALYESIYTETKVQAALGAAEPWVRRGHGAASQGDRETTLAAIAQLERIHTMLLAEFTLRIVDREGEPTGVWRFPEAASDATNYYIVVQAIGPNGAPLSLPIESEETGRIEEVDIWAVRVPEVTYESVRADRLDDGVIQRNILGLKQYGFLDVEYLMPVQGGTITEW